MKDDAGNDEQGARSFELVDELIQGWRALIAPISTDAGRRKADPFPQRAYLLFNRLESNPLAQELIEQFPKWVRDRCAVPDGYFEHRDERAPFLLELPEELLIPASGAETRAVRNWLAHCLEFTAAQVYERTTQQDFCGIVVSAASAQTIASHWVTLGNQCPPFKDESVLFRYHDARVMQRVWPALSTIQQSRWLGPVTQWWSLRQPWGPFNDKPEPAEWFQAKTPALPHGVVSGGSPHNLFDEAQWFLSGISPSANMIWRSYADRRIPSQAQPDSAASLITVVGHVSTMNQSFYEKGLYVAAHGELDLAAKTPVTAKGQATYVQRLQQLERASISEVRMLKVCAAHYVVAASLVAVVWDAVDAKKAGDKGNELLKYAYYGRVAAGVGTIGAGISAAIWFERARVVLWCARVTWVSAAFTIAASYVIDRLKEKEWIDWLEAQPFRRDDSRETPHPSEASMLARLSNAIEDMQD